MGKAKQKIFLFAAASCLNLAAFFVFSGITAKAELNPNSVKINPFFKENFQNYANSVPALGPFTGGEESDTSEVLPFIYKPSTVFKFSFDNSGSQTYQKGENISIKGKMSYSSQSKEDFSSMIKENCKVLDKKDQSCTIPDIYYPKFSDLGVFVQVWRKDDGPGSNKGDYLVDEFYSLQGASLQENEQKEFSVDWKIPEQVKSGKYYFSFYVNSNKRFSLLGFPPQIFSSGVVYDFSVAGEGENGIELDKDNIKINGQAYAYRQPAPEITMANDNKIKVEIPVTNLDSTDQNIKLYYKLSGWSQEDPKDVIISKTESRLLAPGEKSVYQIDLSPDTISSVENLEIFTGTSQSQSMANVRFVLKDRSRGLFRFLGLADSGQDFLVPMFCIRNANYGGYFDGTVKLVFTGQDGQPRTYEKSGAIATEDRCFVVKDAKFNFQKNAPLKIAGEIYDKNNHLVDKQEVNFLSLPLDNQGKSVISETQKNLESFGTNKIVIIGIVILLIVLILAVLLFFKRKQSTYE